jgi:hypothetical protein
MEKRIQGYSETRDNRDKARFAQFTRSIVRVVGLVFGFLVAFLQIKDIKPDALLTPSSADIIWRVALIIYYWSWVGGFNFDLNVQELAYIAFPGQGRWSQQLYFILAVFIVMAATLLTSFGNIAYFSLALTCFLIVDYASWFCMRLYFRQSIDHSRIHYTTEQQFYEVEILTMVQDQVFGLWKLWRLLLGAGMVGVADLFSFNHAFQNIVVRGMQNVFPWLSSTDAGSFFYSALFLIYVVVMESWLWFHRIRLYARLGTLDYLSGTYQLTPR